MSRLLVLGIGALPGDRARFQTASGLRAWQFGKALHDAGLDVELALVQLEKDHAEAPGAEVGNMNVRHLPTSAEHAEQLVRTWVGETEPRALIGASTYASYLLAQCGSDAPLWVDLNGDPIAEGQSHARAKQSSDPIFDALWMLVWCARRGDRFSVVSKAQRHALLGQLGILGRLNQETVEEDFVAVVPESPFVLPPVATPEAGVRKSTILFSGGFNSWVDRRTLVDALRAALAAEPSFDFVATGGALPGFLEQPWQRFSEDVETFPDTLRRRIRLAGWVGGDELREIEDRALCGVVPELGLPERELGGQNRSLRWMMRGIPVVTSPVSELGRTLETRRLALTYPPGDSRALADCFLRLARDPDLPKEVAVRAREFVLSERSIATTTPRLVEWARLPTSAPDRALGVPRLHAARLSTTLRDQLSLEDEKSGDA